MNDNRPIPASLKAVAIIFIFAGILAVIEVLVALAHGGININFGVLGLFIGPGLLALRSGCRAGALVLLRLAMVVIPISLALMLFHSGPVDFRLLGQKIGHASKGLGFAFAVVAFFLALWQYRVLTRPDIRRLFGLVTDQHIRESQPDDTSC